MRTWWILLLLPISLVAQPLRLMDAFGSAVAGDYWIANEGQNQILLLVQEKEEASLLLDEITRPNHQRVENWKEWVETGAPRHTSWISHQIDLKTGQIVHSYSRTHDQFVDNSPTNAFLSTLFRLNFQPMNDLYRKRIGPITAADPMSRPLWQPRLRVDGQTVQGAPFSAWTTRWPQDQTELAGKGITIYIPKGRGNYPNYFPYWVEINDGIYTAKLRIVDSGRNLLTSP